VNEAVPPEVRTRRFARIASGLFWAFTFGFAICTVQSGRALRSDKIWANYRGVIVTAAEMRHSFVFFLSATLVCLLLAIYWHRFWRRQ
jgi:hypothetical protein